MVDTLTTRTSREDLDRTGLSINLPDISNPDRFDANRLREFAVLIPVLQRGSVDLVGCPGLPRRASRRRDLCLRQQLQGPHGRTRAKAAGAVVRTEPLQGKGNVVRRMFADVEADVYVLVDGDDTYHAPSAPLLISKLVSENLDMVNVIFTRFGGHRC